VLVFASTF